MKKFKMNLSMMALALGLAGAFAFTPAGPKSTLYRPVYNAQGQITNWLQVSGTFHCVTNPNRICTATFKNDDPNQDMLSSSPVNFTQP